MMQSICAKIAGFSEKTACTTIVSMLLALGFVCITGISNASDAASVADTIVVNADVRTSDKGQPKAEAFAVLDGRFQAIGTSEDMRQLAGPDTVVIDAKGATVTPGLIDGHIHLLLGMVLATGVDLSDIVSKDDWLTLIAQKVATLQPGQWLLGGGWNHALSDGVLPTRQMLDTVTANNPAFIFDIDGHTAWANSMALELAGITANSKVPAGGEITLDPETGKPTGILKEGAGDLIRVLEGYKAALDPEIGAPTLVALANSYGFTSVHEMNSDTSIYGQLAEAGALNIRVWAGKSSVETVEEIEAYAAEREATAKRRASSIGFDRGPMYREGYIKLMVDGVLSTRTALMKEPYSDQPDAHAEPFLEQETLTELVKTSHSLGFPVAIHAIGDQAVNMALNAFENAGGKGNRLPDRIEHIEVVKAVDEDRFIALNVAASMQPIHATCCVGDYVIDRIGEKRMPDAYAWRRKLDKGITLSLSSDWPTSPMSAFKHIASAMARETNMNGTLKSWDEGQTLSFDEALYAYTQATANLSDWGDVIGSITVGKWADFVVLEELINAADPASVAAAKVRATYLAGQNIYQK